MKVTVVGLGYVGLTLALTMADSGNQVYGLEINDEIIKTLLSGKSHVMEPGIDELLKSNLGKTFFPGKEPKKVSEFNEAIIYCLPTPLNAGVPDLSYFIRAVGSTLPYVKKDTLFVIRSTVPVGTTRKLLIPLLKENQIFQNSEPMVAVCPERTAEGVALQELRSLPQLGAATSPEAMARAEELFSFVKEFIKLDSLEAAEAAKLFSNVFRDVQFALANEFALLAEEWGFDIHQVIEAINKDYPRANIARPGLGVGGPCLSKDTYLMGYSAKEHQPRVSLQARKLNEEIVHQELNRILPWVKGKKALVCGLAFKGRPETNDIRNSAGVEVIKLLLNQNFVVYGFDPALKEEIIFKTGALSEPLEKAVREADLIIIANNNRFFEREDFWETLSQKKEDCFILDGWGLSGKRKLKGLIKLGIGNEGSDH
ncbi:MAG: nucleotide sugar dehydrogenase [bacterium]